MNWQSFLLGLAVFPACVVLFFCYCGIRHLLRTPERKRLQKLMDAIPGEPCGVPFEQCGTLNHVEYMRLKRQLYLLDA